MGRGREGAGRKHMFSQQRGPQNSTCGKMRVSCPVWRKLWPTQIQNHLLVVLRHCPPNEPWKGRRGGEKKRTACHAGREGRGRGWARKGGGGETHVFPTNRTAKFHSRAKSSFRMCLPRKLADILTGWSEESRIHKEPLLPHRILQGLILFDRLIWPVLRRNNSL